jgi:hypothetical protein
MMSELMAVKIEEGPCVASPMDFDDTAYAFRALIEAVNINDVCVGINQVSGHEGSEVGHLEIWVWHWPKVVDWLQSNQHRLEELVEEIHENGTHIFDSVEQGIEFLGNLLKVEEYWRSFITEEDELSLIVKY